MNLPIGGNTNWLFCWCCECNRNGAISIGRSQICEQWRKEYNFIKTFRLLRKEADRLAFMSDLSAVQAFFYL